MEMNTRVIDTIHVLDLTGRFDTNTVSPVADWLEQITATPHARVLVNLAQTTFVDSTALATLIQALRRSRDVQGDLALCGMHRPISMIFELTRLDRAFTIFQDEDQAMQVLALGVQKL